MKTQKAEEGMWLYKDGDNDQRMFAKELMAPDNAEDWLTCTDAEKIAWENEHNPEPLVEDAQAAE